MKNWYHFSNKNIFRTIPDNIRFIVFISISQENNLI